jgi:PAS domain S-box-containing protein
VGAGRGADERAGATEAALLEDDLEELYEHAPVGYVSTRLDGAIVKVNETLLGWTGHRRADLLAGMRLHDLLAPGARIYYETHYAPLLQMQGSVREISVELVRADGARLPVLLSSAVVRDGSGTPRIVRTTVFEATERRRYERELLRARADAELRAQAARALEHVNDGVVLVGDDGRVGVLNPAAETILGVAPDAALGRPIADLVPEWPTLADRVPVGHGREPKRAVTLPLRRGEQEQWLSIAATGAHEGVVFTIRDVTADHALETLRSDVVAIVSHELRTPLSGMYGSAQTLLVHGEALGAEMRRQLLELIVQQGERLTGILDDLLLTSRLDTGAFAVEVATFDAAEVAERVRDGLRADARVRLVVAAERLRIAGDAARTTQVLANVVDNALEYSDGPVRLAVARDDASVRFTIADEGPGIPPAERERVFEKFHRLDPGQVQGGGGTGLGLYIARELTRRMHGRIGFLPAERGTVVFVDLPAAPA